MTFTYHIPVVEHSNKTPKCRLWYNERGVSQLLFSQSRQCEWWFKVVTKRHYGHHIYPVETPWLPVPGFDFVLPDRARLIKETAILPPISVREWGANNGWA